MANGGLRYTRKDPRYLDEEKKQEKDELNGG
jgi:hypothetical protein